VSDTPRTDVLLISHNMAPTHISLISLARELERELNAANERIKRLEDAGDEMAQEYRGKLCFSTYDELKINEWILAKEDKP
jgi:uncharacterized protein Yka (UPF0111/DUF47 family)